MGQDVHFVPPQYDVQLESRGILERPAKVVEHDGMTVCLVSFNRTGLYFGEDIGHDPAGGEWTWHTVDECPYRARTVSTLDP
jgi:hypothetical protein